MVGLGFSISPFFDLEPFLGACKVRNGKENKTIQVNMMLIFSVTRVKDLVSQKGKRTMVKQSVEVNDDFGEQPTRFSKAVTKYPEP